MSWNDEPFYKRDNLKVITNAPQVQREDDKDKRPKLQWSHEIMIEKKMHYREPNESPLKIWWLNQQKTKNGAQG
jgi:hypothetical protein